jgi:hypothetical protein
MPTIYILWHDEFKLTLLLGFVKRLQFPLTITNDSFGERVIEATMSRLGAPVSIIPQNANRKKKLEIIRNGLIDSKKLLIAADYGQPWFRVHPTSWKIARSVGGAIEQYILRQIGVLELE